MKKQLIIKNEVVEMTFEEALVQFTPAIHKEINRQKSNFDRADEEKEDMFQDASIWLWKAYQKYDIETGYHFFTYAARYIQKGVQSMTVKNNTQKRDGLTVSMDADMTNDDENFSLSNILSHEIDYDSPMIAKEVLKLAIDKMSDLEIEYLFAMLGEWGMTELAEEKGTTRQNVNDKYSRIKRKIREAAREYKY